MKGREQRQREERVLGTVDEVICIRADNTLSTYGTCGSNSRLMLLVSSNMEKLERFMFFFCGFLKWRVCIHS